MFNKILNMFKKKEPMDMLKEIHQAVLNREVKEDHYDNVEYSQLEGPYQHVLKIINKQSIRMIRIEVPKEKNKDQRIVVHVLERTHDILKDIDNFYQGDSYYFEKINGVIEFVETSTLFGSWIKEHIDRTKDREQVQGTVLETDDQVPDKDQVLCALIKNVLIIDFMPDQVTMVLRLKGKYGKLVKKVTTSRENAKSFQINSVYVLTSLGKETGLQFGKCRKYIMFDKENWRKLRDMMN